MFLRKKPVAVVSQPQPLPEPASSPAHRLANLTTVNIGLTALASIGPRRFRPHAQAALAMIAAAQALWTLLRKPH